MITLCHSFGFPCQQRFLKMFPGPVYLLSEDRGNLIMTFTGKFVYMAHHFLLNPFGLSGDREEWWFEKSVS